MKLCRKWSLSSCHFKHISLNKQFKTHQYLAAASHSLSDGRASWSQITLHWWRGALVQTNRRPRGTQPVVIQEEGEPVPTTTTPPPTIPPVPPPPPPSKTGGESRKTVAVLPAQAALFLRAPWTFQGHKQRGVGRVRRGHGIVLRDAESSKALLTLHCFARL